MIDMKFSAEGLLRIAKEEEGVRFSVGGWVREIDEELGTQVTTNVFSQFLNMSRRERDLTIEELAESLGISPDELLLLEEGKERPDPRIVSKVARMFGVPPRRLAQLAGLVVQDQEVQNAFAAFAASSSTKPLEQDAKKALYEFIKTLTKM